MANLRTNNLSGEQGQNAYRGSVFFNGSMNGTSSDPFDYLAFCDGDFNYLHDGTSDWTAWVLCKIGSIKS